MPSIVDTKCCETSSTATNPTAPVVCPVDGEPCEVLVRFAWPSNQTPDSNQPPAVDPGLEKERGAVQRCLPGGRCRLAEQQIASLPGLRLGKHERRILLAAPRPAAE